MGFSTLISQARATDCAAARKDVLLRDATETVDAGIYGMVNNDDVVACLIVLCEDNPVVKSIGKTFLRQYLSRNPPPAVPR